MTFIVMVVFIVAGSVMAVLFASLSDSDASRPATLYCINKLLFSDLNWRPLLSDVVTGPHGLTFGPT